MKNPVLIISTIAKFGLNLSSYLRKLRHGGISRTYGKVGQSLYRQGLPPTGATDRVALVKEEDITRQTLPTYPAVRQLFRQVGDREADRATAAIEWLSRVGLLRYAILSFAA